MCEKLVYSLEIEAKKPVVLAVIGFDASQHNTIFFDRTYGSESAPFSGKVVLDFPLPVCPKSLKVNVFDRLTGSGRQIKSVKVVAATALAENRTVGGYTQSYIDFALNFALMAGVNKVGRYKSSNGQYVFEYLPYITSLDTGEKIDTPARVSHQTGIIYASKEAFDGLSVPNRFFILMHEYVHFANGTEDETECDLLAAKTLLDKGFSETECLYSVSKLFLYNAEKDSQIQMQQEQRVQEVKNFIKNYRRV